MREKNKILSCVYIKQQNNYVTGCGMRANYNKYWRYCPYCGKNISNLSKIKEEKN